MKEMICDKINTYRAELKRFLLFQFFFVYAYFNFFDVSKYSYEFKDGIYGLCKYFNYRNPQIDQLLSNPVPIFQGLVVVQLISAIMAVLGNKFFSFLSGVLLLVINLINNSPFRLKQGGVSGKFILESFSMEFMLSLALVLAIFAQSFSSSEESKTESKPQEKVKEAESEKPKTVQRDSKPQSSKGKKKQI